MRSLLLPLRPARLVALSENIQPAQFLLETDVCMMGRADTCQIQISQETISRIHAVIEYDPQRGYVLHDSNSANGTYLNGQRLHEPCILKNQDEIGLSTAAALLRFEAVPAENP